MDKCVIDNVVYVSKSGGCTGCAGQHNSELCEALPSCGSVHWVREDSHIAPAKTLRDEFAMAALQGMLSGDPHCGDENHFSRIAFKIADAMLKARERK